MKISMLSAKTLKERGYRITSRKHNIASRVDREDWVTYSEDNNYPVCADWYRRVLSEDKLTVSAITCKKLPTSCHDNIGYVEVVYDN